MHVPHRESRARLLPKARSSAAEAGWAWLRVAHAPVQGARAAAGPGYLQPHAALDSTPKVIPLLGRHDARLGLELRLVCELGQLANDERRSLCEGRRCGLAGAAWGHCGGRRVLALALQAGLLADSCSRQGRASRSIRRSSQQPGSAALCATVTPAVAGRARVGRGVAMGGAVRATGQRALSAVSGFVGAVDAFATVLTAAGAAASAGNCALPLLLSPPLCALLAGLRAHSGEYCVPAQQAC
eukprot:scaffold4747_cov99-Isochrysis_galbana.AAC.8